MNGGEYSRQVDNFNKINKGDLQIRKCLKCVNFDKTVYQCKIKVCSVK